MPTAACFWDVSRCLSFRPRACRKLKFWQPPVSSAGLQSDAPRYDVVIVGGAFSGAATALLLRRQMPRLRVLIVEKLDTFDAKVGEATTEMSAMFLTRRLAL